MGVQAAGEDVGEQHGVVDRRQRDAVPRQNVRIELDVVADLQDGVVLQQAFQQHQGAIAGDLPGGWLQHVGGAVAERHVAGASRCQCQRHAGDLGAHRIERGGLDIDGDEPLRPRRLDPADQIGLVLRRLVVRLDGSLGSRCRSRRQPRGGGAGGRARRRQRAAGLQPGDDRAERLLLQERQQPLRIG